MRENQTIKIRTFLNNAGLEAHKSISIGTYSSFIYCIQRAIYVYRERNNREDDDKCYEFSLPYTYMRAQFSKKIKVDEKRVYTYDHIRNQFISAGLITKLRNYSIDRHETIIYSVTDKYKWLYNDTIKSSLTLAGLSVNDTNRGRLIIVKDKALNAEFNDNLKKIKVKDMNYNDTERQLLDTLANTKLEIPLSEYTAIESLPVNKRESYTTRLISYMSGDHWVSLSNLSGRLYSSFGNLPRTLRKYIKLKDPNTKTYCSLGSIDLKAAQPFLLSQLPELQDDKYKAIVTTDDIYNWILSQLPTTKLPAKYNDATYTRDLIKVEFYRFIFSESNYNSPVDYVLEQYLPEFYEKVKNLKTQVRYDKYERDNDGHVLYDVDPEGKKTKRLKTEDRSNLAIKLQTIEANIYIPVWLSHATSTLPLHDSIYFPINTRIDYREKIRTALINRMESMGITGYQFNEE